MERRFSLSLCLSLLPLHAHETGEAKAMGNSHGKQDILLFGWTRGPGLGEEREQQRTEQLRGPAESLRARTHGS